MPISRKKPKTKSEFFSASFNTKKEIKSMKTVKLSKQVVGKYTVIYRMEGKKTVRQIVKILGISESKQTADSSSCVRMFGRIIYEFVRGPFNGKRFSAAFVSSQQVKVWTRLVPEIDKWMQATKPSRIIRKTTRIPNRAF